MASIVLIDDHLIVMDALQYLIESEGNHTVIGKFKSGNEFKEWMKKTLYKVELAIIDVKLPDILGIEIAAFLNEKFPEVKTMLLSQFTNTEFVYAGLEVSISAYVLKSSGGNELLKAIDSVMQNETYLSPEVAKLIAQSKNKSQIDFHLTERERDVLELYVYGFSNKEISQKLNIEPSTIDFHKKNLRQKLNVNKSIELVIRAIELGFVSIN